MLSTAAHIFLHVLAAPQATAPRHVRADPRAQAEHKLALLVVGELFARQLRVAIRLDHVASWLVQQTVALIASVIERFAYS